MTDADVVTIADVRARKWCVSGAREFCRVHGLSWEQFVREGMPCSAMLATGNDMARQLVDDVRSRSKAHG